MNDESSVVTAVCQRTNASEPIPKSVVAEPSEPVQLAVADVFGVVGNQFARRAAEQLASDGTGALGIQQRGSQPAFVSRSSDESPGSELAVDCPIHAGSAPKRFADGHSENPRAGPARRLNVARAHDVIDLTGDDADDSEDSDGDASEPNNNNQPAAMDDVVRDPFDDLVSTWFGRHLLQVNEALLASIGSYLARNPEARVRTSNDIDDLVRFEVRIYPRRR